MKYIRITLLPLLYILPLFCALFCALSCASRPVSLFPVSAGGQYPQAGSSPPEAPSEEPTEAFERALWNVKKDSPEIKKYIDDLLLIQVKGECSFGGKVFTVLYDLAAAEKSGADFRIPFVLEEPDSGVSVGDALFWRPAAGEAGLLLSFDDDYWPVWQRYFDLFERSGARLTFFVTGLPDEAGELAGFCAEALRRGHSIGYHSLHHLDLRKVSRTIFDTETTRASEVFREAGILLSAFAYPYGFSQDWMREALAPAFSLTRGYGANFRLYGDGAINGYLVSKAIDNILYPDDDQFENHIRLMLLAAKFLGGKNIVPFTSHDISDNAQWGIKPGRLEYLLRTAEELKLRFYTYHDI